jgi:metal-responsive CopG/Arc/MetJ family transcriptional regulator
MTMATVKTAVSIEETLFEQAEVLAEELQISRSKVFAIALEQFLQRHEGRKLLDKLNKVYAESGRPDEKKAAAQRAKHRRIVEGTW